jgi:hypothetical protein
MSEPVVLAGLTGSTWTDRWEGKSGREAKKTGESKDVGFQAGRIWLRGGFGAGCCPPL